MRWGWWIGWSGCRSGVVQCPSRTRLGVLEKELLLLLGEDRMEIVGVNGGIVTIPPFWVDIPSSS